MAMFIAIALCLLFLDAQRRREFPFRANLYTIHSIPSSLVYLAVLIDVYSLKYRLYAIGKTLSSELALAALRMALTTRNTEQLIHHSDQDIQYTSAKIMSSF